MAYATQKSWIVFEPVVHDYNSQYHEDYMGKVKEYTVADLFYTDWKELDDKTHAEVFALHQKIQQHPVHPRFDKLSDQSHPSVSPLEGEINADASTSSATDVTDQQKMEYGVLLIAILRRLRKNWRLVDKINELQAVDIFNELDRGFLSKPWYTFPQVFGWVHPADQMAKSSFDRFIYADNEFTSFLATSDDKYLHRLAATLYALPGDTHFDKEEVEARAELIKETNAHQLQLIFYTYGHVRNAVVKRARHLIETPPQHPSVSPLEGESNTNKVKPSGAMWYQIKHQVARTGVFGTFDQLGQANMYIVIDHLELLAKEKADAKP